MQDIDKIPKRRPVDVMSSARKDQDGLKLQQLLIVIFLHDLILLQGEQFTEASGEPVLAFNRAADGE